MEKKIFELSEEEILWIYSVKEALKEVERNNEVEHAFIQIDYFDSREFKEFINIFGIIRSDNYFTLENYIQKEFKEKFMDSTVETDIMLDHYGVETLVIGQKVVIKMTLKIVENKRGEIL